MSDQVIIGRSQIAQALDKDEKTVSSLIARGIMSARKFGPYRNSPIAVTAAEIERVRALYEGKAA